jgi:hypothetical protein
MKKALIAFGFILYCIAGYGQTDTIQNGENMGTAREKINETILKANSHADSVTLFRGLIDLNTDWISDILNDSLPDLRTDIDSKAPLNSPSFTGTYIKIGTDTVATRAYARGEASGVVVGDTLDIITGDVTFTLAYPSIVSVFTDNSVSAQELNASGVESELEGVLDLQDLQGAVTDAQVPNDITISSLPVVRDSLANVTGDLSFSGLAATIQDDAVQIDDISASGTADNTTYLRGDGQWESPPGGVVDSTAAGFGLDESSNTFSVDTTNDIYSRARGVALESNVYDTTQFVAGTGITLTDNGTTTTISASGGSGGYSLLEYIIGTTTNAPTAGDSLLTHGDLYHKRLEVYRASQYGNLLMQVERDTLGWDITDSTLAVHPVYASGDRMRIHVYDSTNITAMALRDTAASDAFPQIAEVDSSEDTNWDETHTVDMNDNISVGDLLLHVVTTGGDNTLTINTSVSGSNWTIAAQWQDGTTTLSTAVIWKIAEGSDTLQLTSAGENGFLSNIAYRITGFNASTPIQIQTISGNSTNADPPSLTPTGGSDKYLWIVGAGFDNMDTWWTAAPTDFSNLVTKISASGSGASLSTATREYEYGSAYDPGAGTSISNQWTSFTLIVLPE